MSGARIDGADAERHGAPVGSVCFVTPDFTGVIRNGGIGTHFWLMSRLLAQRGWKVHVLFCGPVDDETAMAALPARLAADGIGFTWLDAEPEPAWWRIPSHGDRALRLSQRAFEALEELHARHRFDLIEFSDWRALGFRCAQAKRAGVAFADVRLAVKLHSTTEWQRRGNLENRASPRELELEYCERYAFERADVQFSPTRYMVEDTRAAGWEVREDVIVAYPFPVPEAEPVAQRDVVVELVFFGRLERRKGLDLFLEALDELPGDVPVLFLGRDAHIDGRRSSEIIAERIGDRPHRVETELDRAGALAELSRGDRLAVIASQSETFGFTVAECIANRIPFVAARAGGIPEVVRHAEARERWLFAPTVAGLADALRRRLAADGADERRLRTEVAAACDPGRWNDDVEASYRRAIALPARPRPAAATGPATVTVVLTHRDQADSLPRALASLQAQTRLPDEVLVIDDGSTEPRAGEVFSAQQAQYPDWTFIRQERGGCDTARNRGLALASGDYLLALDAGDCAAPELTETLLGAMRLNAGLAAAACHALALDEPQQRGEGLAFRIAPVGGPRILAVSENVFSGTAVLFRADALRSAGGFEQEPEPPHRDRETLTKLAFLGLDIDVVPRVLIHHDGESGFGAALPAERARSFLLRRRRIEQFLIGADLTRAEQVALWECLVALGAPREDLAQLQVAHEELAAWAQTTLAEADAWRESQLQELRAFLQAQLAEASDRADRAEQALAANAAQPLPLAQLWRQTLDRTARGGARRLRTRRRSALQALRRR
jgi:glycosyltransferase involved in cell wall biosynthesis/GT2 family glycosyltransferase